MPAAAEADRGITAGGQADMVGACRDGGEWDGAEVEVGEIGEVGSCCSIGNRKAVLLEVTC
jgi:hypothetical protein